MKALRERASPKASHRPRGDPGLGGAYALPRSDSRERCGLCALHQAAAQLGLQVPPQHGYVDEGFSGTRLDRPAFDAMRDAAADGLLDVVLVFAPDRPARNDVHQQVVLEELAARGVRVHFVERPIGEKAEGYRWVTSPDGRQKTVVLHKEEAAHVRDMYRWVLEEGLSARAVARRLTAQGVRPRRAARWTGARVRHLLVNPAFTGTAAYNRLMAAVPTHPRKAAALRKVAKSSHLLRPREQWQTTPIAPRVDEATQAAVKLHRVVCRRRGCSWCPARLTRLSSPGALREARGARPLTPPAAWR